MFCGSSAEDAADLVERARQDLPVVSVEPCHEIWRRRVERELGSGPVTPSFPPPNQPTAPSAPGDSRIHAPQEERSAVYDVIVIGARVAGAPTAMLLAKEGYTCLCVDRATFPSDTVSTHMITVEGSAQLKRWGLLDQVDATGCPPVTNIELDLDFERYGHFTLTGFPEPVDDGFAAIYAPKRTVLDKILVDAAAAAGAEVSEGFAVQEVLTDGDRVVGIRGKDATGREVTERARVVVGADGMRSVVARTVGRTGVPRRAAQGVRVLHLLGRRPAQGTGVLSPDPAGR